MATSSRTFFLEAGKQWQALCLPLICLVLTSIWVGPARAEPPQGTAVAAGDSVHLLQLWPAASKAGWEELATIEFWIRPDATTLARPRANLICFSNNAGADVASVGVSFREGVVQAIVLATYFDSKTKLTADRWTHVALTINSKTINPQVKLWIDGRLAAKQLVLSTWPGSFQVGVMLSDHWSLQREFSGQLGDVRISRVVRYQQKFEPVKQFAKDDATVLLLSGAQIPLVRSGGTP